MRDIVTYAVTSLITIVIAMMGFWMLEARNYITRSDAIQLIEANSPYAKDKVWIVAEINRANEANKELKNVIDKTNEVLNELRVEIAVLNENLKSSKVMRFHGDGTDFVKSGGQ
jgi:peptidoglycan hydrolase CwlO-like protein